MISVEYRHEEQTDGRYEADDKTEALSLLANHLACMGTPRALDRRHAMHVQDGWMGREGALG